MLWGKGLVFILLALAFSVSPCALILQIPRACPPSLPSRALLALTLCIPGKCCPAAVGPLLGPSGSHLPPLQSQLPVCTLQGSGLPASWSDLSFSLWIRSCVQLALWAVSFSCIECTLVIIYRCIFNLSSFQGEEHTISPRLAPQEVTLSQPMETQWGPINESPPF